MGPTYSSNFGGEESAPNGVRRLEQAEEMQILTEIFRDHSLKIHGKTDHRSAVRAVVVHDKNLLMVHSTVNGDYKFPGGGVEENEHPEAALRREVSEECGMNLTRILEEIGSIVEYAYPMKSEFDVFKMTSSYYLCEVDGTVNSQNLDEYEEELGFQPVWIDIDTAIQTNKTVISVQTKWPPVWTAREVFMLEYLKAHCLDTDKLTVPSTAGNPPPAPHAPGQ